MDHDQLQKIRKHNLAKLIDSFNDENGRGGVARLADKLDKTSGYISQLASLAGSRSNSRPITEKSARAIEIKLQLPAYSLDQASPSLATEKDSPLRYGVGTNRVPLISMVQAGEMCESVTPYPPGGYDDLVEVHVSVTEGMYALKVSGNSMTQPSGIPSFPEGMTIVVDPKKEAKNGSLVIARDGDGKATFKKLRYDGDVILLEPLNPNFKPILIEKELHLCGVVVEGFFLCQ